MDNLKHVSFDFGGVIHDSNDQFITEFLIIGNCLTGMSISRKTVLRNWGCKIDELLEKTFPGVNIVTYFEERHRFKFHEKVPPLVKGAPEAVRKISSKYSTSIITKLGGITFFETIRGLEIEIDQFDFIQTGDDTDFSKPDPEVFNKILNDYRCDEVLHIGDHISDYEAASGARIHFAAVLSGLTTREEFLDQGLSEDMIFNSITELPNLLGL